MKDFLFTPEQAGTPVSALSGGERGRLTLARALAKPSNLLVLDEPTNDLDLETLDLLRGDDRRLSGHRAPGQSHDRDFLDRTVSAVVVAGGRRALERICRRLYRHGGAARRRRDGEGGRERGEARRAKEPKPSVAAARQDAACRSRTSTRWKRCPRASPRSKPRSPSCRRDRRPGALRAATAPPSTRPPRRSRRRRPISPHRRRMAAAGGTTRAGGGAVTALIPGRM